MQPQIIKRLKRDYKHKTHTARAYNYQGKKEINYSIQCNTMSLTEQWP